MSTTSGDLQSIVAALAAAKLSPQPATPKVDLPLETKIDLLHRLYESGSHTHRFQPGQLVKWKTGLQARPIPGTGEPAIVFKVLDTPIFDGTSDSGFPTFRDPLDLIIGCIGDQGQFLLYHFPSYRFEPYEAPAQG